MKYYEIQEQEARFRSILAGYDVKEEIIDEMVPGEPYPESTIESMRKYVLEMKRKEMEAMSESLLENAFREPDINKEDNMTGSRPETAADGPPKKFEALVNRLKLKVDMARQLKNRSTSLVSTFIGSPPILAKDSKEKTAETMPTTMLADVLEEIDIDLGENLEEISQNLDKLENTW